MLYEVDRYTSHRDSLKSLIAETAPDKIGIEHPVFGEDYSEGLYALYMFSMAVFREAKVDTCVFLPPQVKRFAKDVLQRPSGWNMDKPDMVEAAKKDTGGGGRWANDEADAYHVARGASRFWLLREGVLKEEDLSEWEQHVFLEVKTWKRGKKAGRVERRGMTFREGEKFFLFSE